MRNTALFIILFVSSLSQAQTSILAKEVTVTDKNTTGYKLIEYLQSETGFSINYSESVLKISKNIKLKQTKATFKYFLDKIFELQQVEYIVKEQKILVSLSKTKSGTKTKTSRQSFITIKGKIIEEQTGKRIAFATISIKNHAIGAVTDTKGEFVFLIPTKYKNDSLIVSCIGYENYRAVVPELTGKKNKIELEKKVFELLEVEIKPKNPKEIVKKAFAKIPDNYITKSTNMSGFYREMTFENDTCVQMAEAAYELYYRPYSEYFNWRKAYRNNGDRRDISFNACFWGFSAFGGPVNPKDRMRVVEARASKYHHKNRFILAPTGGAWSLISHDLVKTGLGTIDKMTKRTKLKLLDIIEYNGKPAYKIYAKSILPTNKYHKILYIDIETLGIAAMEYYYRGHDSKTNAYWTPALYKKRKRKCIDIEDQKYFKATTKYKRINGIWYLDYVKEEKGMEFIFSKHYIDKGKHAKIKYDIIREFKVNNVVFDNVKKMPDSTKYQCRRYWRLSEYDLNYNKDFWENYNTSTLPPLHDSIYNQLEQLEPLEQQFATKFLKNNNLPIPIAKKTAFINQITKLNDDYHWLENPADVETLNYIKAENSYTENFMLALKQKERDLFSEMLKRQGLDTTELSKKTKNGAYEYYYKASLNGDNENIYRRMIGGNNEELVLDIGKKAMNHPNYWVDISSISPNNKIFAYTEPITDGYDSRTVFKNMETGKNVDSLDKIANIIWGKNNSSFLYLKWDETNWPYAVYKHKIGTKQKNDKLIYLEKDKTNNVGLYLQDKKHIVLEARNDYYDNNAFLIKHDGKEFELLKIATQKRGFAHYFSIKNDTLYSLSKEPGGKTILYCSSTDKPEIENWEKITESTGNEFFVRFKILQDYIAILEKENMQTRIRIINKLGKTEELINFDKEESYTIGFLKKDSLKNNTFKYSYTSLASPTKIFEYSINKKQTTLVKQETVVGFDAKKYKTKLLWATSKDGVKIPLSIVYNKKAVKRNSKSPVLLNAYGSYGSPSEPTFLSLRLSLLDRGVIYAIAHVRGGGELGQMWHENAMQLKKKNTFNDYIACAEQLIKEKYTAKGRIVARGGSAGGLTMGAVVNMRPELFNTVIIEAAFLDVLTSLLDTTTKFCHLERVQLGNPTKKEFYDYIKSYSPYQNISKQAYPNLFFSVGLLDSRVAYWNTIKSVAKLRASKTNKKTLLLKTDLYAGHNGYVGKHGFESFEAFIYAFILNNLGIKY